jgi:hep_Hag family protein (fragment)
MNKIFKVVWNRTIQSFVVTSELAKGSVKSSAEQNGTDVSAESGKNGIATVLRLTVISVALFGASNAYAATAGRGLIAVDGNTTLAISGATATGTDTIAIGSGANATTSGAIAIGRDTIVNSQNKSRSSNNITIGHTARAGDDSMEKVSQSIAIGSGVKPNVNGRPEGAWARGDQSIAIGGNVVAYGNSSVAIGGDDLDLVGGTRYSGNATDKFIKYNEKGVKTGEYALSGKGLRDIYKEMTGDTMDIASYSNTIAGQGSVVLGV